MELPFKGRTRFDFGVFPDDGRSPLVIECKYSRTGTSCKQGRGVGETIEYIVGQAYDCASAQPRPDYVPVVLDRCANPGTTKIHPLSRAGMELRRQRWQRFSKRLVDAGLVRATVWFETAPEGIIEPIPERSLANFFTKFEALFDTSAWSRMSRWLAAVRTAGAASPVTPSRR